MAVSVQVFAQAKGSNEKDLEMLNDHVFHLSEVMLRDATSPPAASRVYAYAMVGAYEVAAMVKGRTPHLNTTFSEDLRIKLLSPPRRADLAFCSTYAMMEIGRQLMPSGYMLVEKKLALVERLKAARGFNDRDVAQQVRFAMDVILRVAD